MEWISPNQGNILSEVEGNIIETIRIEINGSENYEITKVSGNFPNGISLNRDNEGYFLAGTLDLVEETTTYYFTLQARDLDTEEFIQRWFSMTVETLETKWDNENKINFEEYEKTYFSYQFKLKNPEGNEVYKKISGELPEGVSLSETGLLYGVPEEDRYKIYEYQIGVYRNDKLILKSPTITIKVDDLSLLNKPIWATDAGIIGYIDYNDEKYLFVKAFDPHGKTVFYEPSDELCNLPDDLHLNTETGEIYGICLTKISQPWNFSIRPYIIESNERIYGDWRTFTLITNAVESDKLITWETDQLPSTKIGNVYNFLLKASSKNKIYYEMVSGNLPKGLKINRNGNIYGIIDYQDLGEYKFIIKAYTYITFNIKEFTIKVEKGLSQNAVDVELYINKENELEYQDLISNFDRSSSYNSSNKLFNIKNYPEIYVATLNTWDNILLKYKFEQFNTPIDFIWKETKKKSFTDINNEPQYDFFYKDFDELYKDSDEWYIKKHSDNETEMQNQYGKDFRPGYLRNLNIKKEDLKIIYKDYSGKVIEDIENIKEEVQEDKTRYYYVDPETFDEYLIQDPKYYVGDREVNPKEIFDYAYFPRKYVEDGEKRIYINKLPIGSFYEKDSLKIVPLSETIYISMEMVNNEKIIKKYILKENQQIEVLSVNKENQYYSYGDEYLKYIDIGNYSEIKEDDLIDNYYEFVSEKEKCKAISINSIREIFQESFKPNQCNEHLYYKLSNQEIIYKDSDFDNFENRKYKLKYNEEKKYYYIEFNGEESCIFIKARNDIDDIYRNVYTYYDGEYKPLVMKMSGFNGEVDYIYYTIYLKDYIKPLTDMLFTCDWDESIKLICEYDNTNDVYQWFRVGEWIKPNNWEQGYLYNIGDEVLYEDNIYTCINQHTSDDSFNKSLWKETNRYIYKASENENYGFEKDIILPNIKSEHIKNDEVKFLDVDSEKELLPEYMKNEYKPTLPLFYGVPRSHDTKLKEINAYEKEGNYWYGRKFVFYEVHFTPKYLNKDSFTIDFYNHKNPNSPEFLLI